MLNNMRKSYEQSRLEREDLHANPIVQFQHWLELALDSEVIEANAMTLATVNASGQPSARMVLLKDVSQSGFVFYSNYESRKAEDIKGSGRAALLFYWDALEKQVRIEGTVTKTSRERSEVYFQSRPRSSQLSAMISPQSQVIPSRNYLEERQHKVERHYPHDLPLPEHWGGYILRPALMEFWQGRPNRLHDRFQYRLEGGQWSIERLAP